MRAGGLEAAFLPAIGGALLSLSLDGQDLLRRPPVGSRDVLSMASFPLVPYANRIAHGRFPLGGRDYQVPLNFGDHPHSLHGVGWQAPWKVEQQGEDALTMAHDHAAGGGWPWFYQAQQRVEIQPDCIMLHLSVRNRSDEAMPVGLGFHPYFLADEATHIDFAARTLWLSTPDMLPIEEAPADALGDWSRSAPVLGKSLIDNIYGGWDGIAHVRRGDGITLTLSAQGAPWLHMFRPPGKSHFCLEPVSHMPDAINRAGGMEMLAPDATRTLSMTIAIAR